MQETRGIRIQEGVKKKGLKRGGRGFVTLQDILTSFYSDLMVHSFMSTGSL